MKKLEKWVVEPHQHKGKLHAFLVEKLKMRQWAKRKIKRAIDNGVCRVNGIVERFASYQLKEGDRVIVDIAAMEVIIEKPLFVVESERILYEDDHMVAYNKPPRCVSNGELTLQVFSEKWLGIKPVHRLDMDTSGVWLLAKTEESAEALEKAFHDRKVRKSYFAIVDGVIEDDQGQVKKNIADITSSDGTVVRKVVDEGKGRYAFTSWEVVRRGKGATLVRCEPLTGRTHQIRLHMGFFGHWILGDHQYKRSFSCQYPPQRMLLHAHTITVPHPLTGENLFVEAPLPKDFLEAMQHLCLLG